MEPSFGVCDFKPIYNDKNSYCVPENLMRNYYCGTEFGRMAPYSNEEQLRLREDIHEIYWNIMSGCRKGKPVAVITAGAPGAGKTTLMESLLGREKKKVAYCDPDTVCLKQMRRTWGAELAQRLQGIEGYPRDARLFLEKDIRQDMYHKWRPASKAANHFVLAHLIRQKMPFYLDGSSASLDTKNMFEYLKEQGYKIHLIHVMASDKVRWESVQERDRSFVQTTKEDIHKKGKLIPQRIHDTYLAFADKIDFYFRRGVHDEAILTATRVKKDEVFSVHDKSAYEEMVTLHNSLVEGIGNKDLLWENSAAKYQFFDY